MYDMWWMIGIIILLTVISIFDIRYHEIPMWSIAVVLAAMAAYVFARGEFELWNMALACVPGVALVLIALVTGEKLGYGDAILVILIGTGIGFEKCIFMLTIALITNSIFAMILLLLKKAKKNTQIPFVPFITLGMGVMTAVCR